MLVLMQREAVWKMPRENLRADLAIVLEVSVYALNFLTYIGEDSLHDSEELVPTLTK